MASQASSKYKEILEELKVSPGSFEILIYCPKCKWKKINTHKVKQTCLDCGSNVRVICDWEME